MDYSLEQSTVIENQAISGSQAIVSAISAALISYLYFGTEFNVKFYGIELAPYMVLSITVLVSEYLQSQGRTYLVDPVLGQKAEDMADIADPLATGLVAAIIILLNNYMGSNPITLRSLYTPLIIAGGASLVGQYFRNATEKTVADLL